MRSDAPGITIEPTWDHLGLRASRSDDVIFADTPVPADAVTGLTEPAAAPRADPALMAWNGLGITALYLGVASAARDWLDRFPDRADPYRSGPSARDAAAVHQCGRRDRGVADCRG